MEEIDTFEKLMDAILVICPNAQFADDNEGQIIVYTNKMFISGTAEATNAIMEMPDWNVPCDKA